MSQERPNSVGWKIPVGCLIALITVLATPFVMMGAAFAGTPFIVLPAIVLPFLYCFGGRRTFLFSLLIQIVGSALLMGTAYMWIVLCAGILPSIAIARGIGMHRPFGTQLRNGIAAAAVGSIASALLASLMVGGNIVDWLYSLVSEAMHALPVAYQNMLTKSIEPIYGMSISPDQILSVVDRAIALILPDSKMRFPAALFGGAILNGLFGVAFGNKYLHKRQLTGKECYKPLREWALPGSMTGGLLLILAISFILYNFNVKNSLPVFMVVLTISEYAFCVQAFGSIARRTAMKNNRRGAQIVLYIALIAAILFGGLMYIAIYGCLSALLGSHGFMAQKVRETMKSGDSKSDKDDNQHDNNENDKDDKGGN